MGMGGGFGATQDPDADMKAVFYNDRTGILFVRATLSDLDIIEQAIQVLNVLPPQVEIEAKFAEVTQEDVKALGFQWWIGNWTMGNNRVGATAGTAPSLGSAATSGSTANPGGVFPNTTPSIPPSGNDGYLTSGVRNTYSDANRNEGTIPTLATVTGIMTEPQFRVAIQALEQRSGVDMLSAPKVTTVSGRQAQIVTADVRTIVTSVGLSQTSSGGNNGGIGGGFSNGGGAVAAQSGYGTTVIPFGPELDVLPIVSSDDVTIQLTIIPSVTEFVGYDNPGQFVPQAQSVAGSTIGVPITAQLPLPRYRARSVITSANVWDGQTVVIGGLIAENSRKTRDKVPVLGDLPLVGRLFSSEANATDKRNLLIFVTPTIIDPTGRRLNDPNSLPFDQNTVPSQKASKH